MHAVERFSLGVRNPTAFLAGAMVSDNFVSYFYFSSSKFMKALLLHFECMDLPVAIVCIINSCASYFHCLDTVVRIQALWKLLCRS